MIFVIFYPNVKESYVLEDLFEITSNSEFILYNLLKISTGYVHSYFFYYPLEQSVLLAIVYCVKIFIVLKILKMQFEKRYKFSAELLS